MVEIAQVPTVPGFGVPPVPIFWITVFVIVAYLMGLACLCLAFRIGSVGGWRRGLREILLFAFFCGVGFVVESWAHARTPYYFYAAEFPDRVSRIRFDQMSWFPQPDVTECMTFVGTHLKTVLDRREIPLSIPILEGSLAFLALWISRLLGGAMWLRPLLAGLALVTVDALLDPIVASTYSCQGGLVRQGLGFWNWHINPEVIAQWHGIPLFNYAGWFGAAVLLVSLAYLIGWGLDVGWWGLPEFIRRAPAGERPRLQRERLWLLALAAPVLVVGVAPTANPPLWVQWLVIPGIIGGAAAAVARQARRFGTGWEQVADLTRGLVLPIAFSIFALFVSGQFTRYPEFLFVALVLTALGLLLTWWPYQSTVHRLAVAIVHVDRFVRLHYLAYPWLLVLLGAAFTETAPSGLTVGVLLAVALAFQIYACVLNDVLDLEIDRTQIRRRNDPLVRGDIGRTTAHVFALMQLPLMLLLTQLVANGRFMPTLLLATACALMALYNRFGKLCPVPPVTDFAQGLAWGLLALYGAQVVAGGTSALAWAVFAYGTGFMTLINGIHGGLRDLANDLRWQRTNTAQFLGARASDSDPFKTESTWAVVAFAFAIHSAMIGVLVWALYRFDLPYRLPWVTAPFVSGDAGYFWLRTGVIAAFAVAVTWCHVLLWRLVRPGWERRDQAGSMHAFAILLLPVIVFTPMLGPLLQVVVPLCFFLPLLLQYIDPIVAVVFPRLRGRIADEVPAPRLRDTGWTHAPDDQSLTLVDEQGDPLRPATRAVAHRGDGVLHRAFSIYLFDRGGRLLLQQRSATKQLWPLYWSNSCCSHPRWGENIALAAQRRLWEELGVKTDLREIFTFRYQARFGSRGSERELCTVYVGIADAVGTFDPTEVAAWEYVEPSALDKKVESDPDSYTPWLRLAWTRLRNRHWPEVAAMVRSERGTVAAGHIVVTNGSGPHEGLVD